MWSVELRTGAATEDGRRVSIESEAELRKLLQASRDEFTVAIVQDGSLVIGVYRQHEPGCWRNALTAMN